MLKVTEYNLPDVELLNHPSHRFMTWIPRQNCIVLGASNRAEEALYAERVEQDAIPVLKRPSGGQTVMLTPGNLLVAVVFAEQTSLQPKVIFHYVNDLIIAAIAGSGIYGLATRGISDISYGNRKISGSSIYRSRNTLLYHAVINVSESASTFEKYLKHPSKEPDYRLGRSHSEFVTSLREIGYPYDVLHLQSAINDSFERELTEE
ncbi:lipoyl protein ligase domain-containing protein [Microbacter margulisiae]|uniref:Lipoate-protein ligase A n=1 Tax=Microbacter margulisiae TaxID=1350067 RepID=A0A7W5DMZ9_9PORP|nr:hypothetical protein [Microbacter margulisiae]MBB3185907.1 lipoate-protein ligase A [Microbacter margulisiae]